tara:strand:+ start:1852 stop:2325 length:474 start_codon:yes stop_codon:yes gene_type:complete
LRKFTLIFIFILTSCEKTNLLPITAENLIEKVYTFKGKKIVLVNVWALWCKPCVEEFPMIIQLQKERNDLEVIFVNADFQDQTQDVIYFLKKHNVGSVSYIKKQKDEPFIESLHPNWSGSLPFTIVYGKNSGHIVDYWEGKEPRLRFSEAFSRALIN